MHRFKTATLRRKLYYIFIGMCIAAVAICSAALLIPGKNTPADTEEKLLEENDKQKEKEPQGEATIAFTGDMMIESGLYSWFSDVNNMEKYLKNVYPLLKSDMTITNLETSIGGEELGVSTANFTFNMPYSFADDLAKLPIDVYTTANNHTLDMGEAGVVNTNRILDEKNLSHTGSFSSEEESENILVKDVNGIKIAVLAYTYATNKWVPSTYLVNRFLNPSKRTFTSGYQQAITEQIARAKELADYVIVCPHWGNEFSYQIANYQQQFADFLVEQGVDLIIGNHPHNIQPAQIVENSQGKKVYLFYALGNFTSSAINVYRATTYFQNMYQLGGIGRMKLKKQEDGSVSIESVTLTPIVNHFSDGYDNFELIPLADYSQKKSKTHSQASANADFSKDWLLEQVKQVWGDFPGLNLEKNPN